MGSRVYLTNANSDVPGYKLALVDTRNPRAPATPATAITTTTAGGSNIQMTETPGGTPLAWITKPLQAPINIGTVPGESFFCNISGNVDAAAINAGPQIRLSRYSGGAEQTAFVTDNAPTELPETMGPNMWASLTQDSWTAQPTFVSGDRLVITPYIQNVGGTMAEGTATMAYDGAAAGAGDTWIEFLSALNVLGPQLSALGTQVNALGTQSRQVGAGNLPVPFAGNPAVPFIGQKSVSFFQDFVWQSTGANVLPPAPGGIWPFDMTVGVMLAEAGFQAATTQ